MNENSEEHIIPTNENSASICSRSESPQREINYNELVNEIICLCQGDQKEDDLIKSRRKLRKKEI